MRVTGSGHPSTGGLARRLASGRAPACPIQVYYCRPPFSVSEDKALLLAAGCLFLDFLDLPSFLTAGRGLGTALGNWALDNWRNLGQNCKRQAGLGISSASNMSLLQCPICNLGVTVSRYGTVLHQSRWRVVKSG